MNIKPSLELVARAQAFVDRKYVAAVMSPRNRTPEIGYVEVERMDLAQKIAEFVVSELAIKVVGDT